MHAVHFESNDVLGALRVVQVEEMLDALQASACDRPSIVAGDFNTWYPTAPERVVLMRSGFVDAFEVLGDSGPTHASGRHLDYVWTRGFDVEGGAIDRTVTTSDHFPLHVELRLSP